jgi:hypothetical protein
MKQKLHAPRTRGEPLPPALLTPLRELFEREGEAATLRKVRISRNALYRALARVPVLLGTQALVAVALRPSEPPHVA